jgi:hypothetical protein
MPLSETLMRQLRDKRGQARAAADAVLTRAAEETRDLTAEELAAYSAAAAEERAARAVHRYHGVCGAAGHDGGGRGGRTDPGQPVLEGAAPAGGRAGAAASCV